MSHSLPPAIRPPCREDRFQPAAAPLCRFRGGLLNAFNAIFACHFHYISMGAEKCQGRRTYFVDYYTLIFQISSAILITNKREGGTGMYCKRRKKVVACGIAVFSSVFGSLAVTIR